MVFHKSNVLVVCIIILALLLRLPYLHQSLWLDEAIQASAVINNTFWGIFTNFLPHDFNPPLSYIITWAFVQLFGNSEISLRLPSLLCGVGLVWLGYRLLQSIFPKSSDMKYRLFGIAFLATGPLLIYYSQEARPYALAALLAMWSMVTFIEYFFTGKGSLREYWLITGLMFTSHYLVWFIWMVQLISLLITKRNWRVFFADLTKISLPLVSILLMAPIIISQLQTGMGVSESLPVWRSLGSFSLKQLLLLPIKILIGRLPIDSTPLYVVLLSVPLLLWGWIVSKLFEISESKSESPKRKITLILGLWLVLPVIIAALVSYKVAIFSYFRFLYIVPVFYILLSLGLSRIPGRYQYIVFGFFMSLNIVTSVLYLSNPDYHRENWKELVTYIDSKNTSDKVLIIRAVSSPFWYYDHSNYELVDYHDMERVKFEKSLWLIKYAQPIFEPDNRTELRLVRELGFQIVEEKHFRGDVTVKYLINSNHFTASVSYDHRN